MTPKKRFLFENDFARPEDVAARTPAYTVKQLEAARKEAFAAGRKASEDDLRDFEERRIAATLEEIRDHVATLAGERERDLDRIAGDAAAVAIAICRKVLPTLAAQNALTEIEGMITRCLSELRE